MTLEVARACVWAALGYVAGKEGCRERLPLGQTPIDLNLSGRAGRQTLALMLSGNLLVDPDSTMVSATSPPVETLVALLLAAIPKTKRQRILLDLPEEFARAGGVLPEVDPAVRTDAEGLLRRLRAKTEKPRKGNVRVHYELGNL